jgi:hypothetical protein
MGGDHSRFFCSPSPVIASGRSGAAPDMNLADEPENPGMSRLLALENSARRLVKANPSRFFFFFFFVFFQAAAIRRLAVDLDRDDRETQAGAIFVLSGPFFIPEKAFIRGVIR